MYILPISWGSIPLYTASLANAVSKLTEVYVLKLKDSNDNLFSSNVNIIHLSDKIWYSRKNPLSSISYSNLKNFLKIILNSKKYIQNISPDIIHFPELYPHISIPFSLFSLDKEYPIVSTLHTTFHSPIFSPIKYGVESPILTIAELTKWLIKHDAIIVHTHEQKRVLIKRGVPSTNVYVIPHGPIDAFNRYSTKLNCDSSIKCNENCILFFGFIGKNKGVEYLIQASKYIFKEIPNSKIIIAGEGRLPIEIPDDDRFEIHNRYIPDEMIPELFMRAKVVVLPYVYHQGHSGVLIVAFSFKKPVIVTNVGDFPNLVKNGINGLIVPPANPKALAEAIIKLLKDDTLARKIGYNGYIKLKKYLSWERISRIHIQIYKKLVKEKNKIIN